MQRLSIRIQKERLENDLVARQKDYEGVADKLTWETDPIEKNSLQAKLDKLINEIKHIERKIEELSISSPPEIISILSPYFEQEKVQIQKAYRLSLPECLIAKELPSSLEALISGLQLPQQEENYSFLEKFVGNLLHELKQAHELKLKQELKEWAEKNIKNCQQLLVQLNKEREQREHQCYPGLLVAISEREESYMVEAWLINNINQYQQYSSSDCEQLKFNEKAEILTNKELSNVPQLVRNWIHESGKNIKQIHVFLPYRLMNHEVDCWKTDEKEDEIIGEFYEVVIRCSERLRCKNPRVMRWRDKGRIFKDKLGQSAVDVFILCDNYNDKVLESTCKKDDVIAVQITTVFQQEQPGTVLWKTAIPLALWIRHKHPTFDNKSVLDKLIKNCSSENNIYLEKDPILVKDIPRRVKDKRLESIQHQPPENHVGRHLCLLWDDPDLLPPEQLLTETNLK